uniref:Uncharacterized protein n=1 Tax=Talaromyces marneffei PM1 TaxID=1077442 RepID=A0A093URN4_TALMA
MQRSQKAISSSKALELLRACNKKLRVLGVLDKLEARQVEGAVNILCTVQTSEKRKKYKLFLHEVLDNGPHLLLLCAIALGQARIASMNKDSRKQLLSDISILSQEFDDEKLRLMASDYGIPVSADESQPHAVNQTETGTQSDIQPEVRKQSLLLPPSTGSFSLQHQVQGQADYQGIAMLLSAMIFPI